MERTCKRCGKSMPFFSTEETLRLTGRFVWAGAAVSVASLFCSGALWFVIPATVVAVAWAERKTRAEESSLCQHCKSQDKTTKT